MLAHNLTEENAKTHADWYQLAESTIAPWHDKMPTEQKCELLIKAIGFFNHIDFARPEIAEQLDQYRRKLAHLQCRLALRTKDDHLSQNSALEAVALLDHLPLLSSHDHIVYAQCLSVLRHYTEDDTEERNMLDSAFDHLAQVSESDYCSEYYLELAICLHERTWDIDKHDTTKIQSYNHQSLQLFTHVDKYEFSYYAFLARVQIGLGRTYANQDRPLAQHYYLLGLENLVHADNDYFDADDVAYLQKIFKYFNQIYPASPFLQSISTYALSLFTREQPTASYKDELNAWQLNLSNSTLQGEQMVGLRLIIAVMQSVQKCNQNNVLPFTTMQAWLNNPADLQHFQNMLTQFKTWYEPGKLVDTMADYPNFSVAIASKLAEQANEISELKQMVSQLNQRLAALEQPTPKHKHVAEDSVYASALPMFKL